MNQINFKRMALAAFAMLVMWVAMEILLEHVLAKLILGTTSGEMWRQVMEGSGWSARNIWVGTALAILNCGVLIWVYASIRPMYGVGTKTALITAAFAIAWMASMMINLANLGLIPSRLALIEGIFEAIELPIAILIGAGVYEGREEEGPEARE